MHIDFFFKQSKKDTKQNIINNMINTSDSRMAERYGEIKRMPTPKLAESATSISTCIHGGKRQSLFNIE